MLSKFNDKCQKFFVFNYWVLKCSKFALDFAVALSKFLWNGFEFSNQQNNLTGNVFLLNFH